MQQGLTDVLCDEFFEKIPLKIKARTSTLKVTCQDQDESTDIRGHRMPTW